MPQFVFGEGFTRGGHVWLPVFLRVSSGIALQFAFISGYGNEPMIQEAWVFDPFGPDTKVLAPIRDPRHNRKRYLDGALNTFKQIWRRSATTFESSLVDRIHDPESLLLPDLSGGQSTHSPISKPLKTFRFIFGSGNGTRKSDAWTPVYLIITSGVAMLFAWVEERVRHPTLEVASAFNLHGYDSEIMMDSDDPMKNRQRLYAAAMDEFKRIRTRGSESARGRARA